MADYCTLAQVKAYLDIHDPQDDALVEALIDRCSVAMDAHCKRTIYLDADADYYYTYGRDTDGYYLWFDDLFSAVTTVLNGDASATEVTSSQYALIDRNDPPYRGIKILQSAGKMWQYNNNPEDAIKVTGRRSYFATLTNDITQACIRFVVWMYRLTNSSQELDRPIITAAGVTLMPLQLPTDIQMLLAPYVRRGL